MSSITESLQRDVQSAGGLAAVLAAARNAFEFMLTEIRARQDPASPKFTAFVMAAGYAADGRDATLFAPSLPRSANRQVDPDRPERGQAPETAEQAAGALAALCLVLISRLGEAVRSPADRQDSEACHEAAQCARLVRDLLTQSSP